MAYREEVIQQRAERFSIVFATLFITTTDVSTGQQEQLLALALSTGHIKLFRVKDAVASWLGRSVPASACMAWKAHQAPVTSLACLHSDSPNALLVSCGEDGAVRAWPISVLLQQVQPANGITGVPSSAPPYVDISPSLEGHISRGVVGFAGATPGITCAILDGQSGQLFAGSTEGGVHIFDIRAAAAAAAGNRSQGAPAPLPCIATLVGHLAGVLCVDVCTRAGLVASGSEDGTLRIWDMKAGMAASRAAPPSSIPTLIQPIHTVCPSMDGPLAPNACAQLNCVRSASPVTTARFQDDSWVVCGLGGKAPALALWSMDAGALAMRVPLPCVPQAMVVQPGEILLAGTAPALYKFSFTGELIAQHDLASPTRSVFALDVLPGNPAGANKSGSIAPGAIAISGSQGGCDLLSRFGTQLAALYPSNLGLED